MLLSPSLYLFQHNLSHLRQSICLYSTTFLRECSARFVKVLPCSLPCCTMHCPQDLDTVSHSHIHGRSCWCCKILAADSPHRSSSHKVLAVTVHIITLCSLVVFIRRWSDGQWASFVRKQTRRPGADPAEMFEMAFFVDTVRHQNLGLLSGFCSNQQLEQLLLYK